MQDKLMTIFRRNIILLGLFEKIIYNYRIQNLSAALNATVKAMDHLSILVNDLYETTELFQGGNPIYDTGYIEKLLKEVFDAQQTENYILAADLLELQLIPYFYQMQGCIMEDGMDLLHPGILKLNLSELKKKDEDLWKILMSSLKPMEELSKSYTIEYTSCGLKTVAVPLGDNNMYLHSNSNAIREAHLLASSWYVQDKYKYVVYGLGLGYHIKELAELDTSVIIDVYESNIEMLQAACAVSDLYYILRMPNVRIHYDPDFGKLADRIKQMDEYTELVIHYPSLYAIKDKLYRAKLEQYFIQYSSCRNQASLLHMNFRENLKCSYEFIDTLRDRFAGKDLYIVAAGPSLDKNYGMLSAIGDRGIILATGTVFKKLMRKGIQPDYVILSDANPRIYAQIEGYEKSEIPILFISTVCEKIPKNYEGRKYLICQKDYKKAEDFAEQNKSMLFHTGGSVSTLALDIGIQFGCRRIISIGLDLAYTDDFVHASDTSRREMTKKDGLRQVEDINGNLIYTSVSLDSFRIWIENRIRGVKGIEFIDATEGGAKIKGMNLMKLSDCIHSSECRENS